jgi:hypothetical protein
MVHQRDAGEPGLVGSQCDVLEPRRRVGVPREPRQLQHDLEAGGGRPCGGGGRLRLCGLGRGILDDLQHGGPALVGQRLPQLSERPHLLRQHARRHRTVSGGVAGPAQPVGGAERHRDGRHLMATCQVEIAAAADLVEP